MRRIPIDLVAWLITLTANLLIGGRYSVGWIVLASGSAVWAIVGLRSRLGSRRVWGLVASSGITIATCLWNWWQWVRYP